jgi:hypothetical protein
MSDTFRVYLFCAHDCETVTIRCAVLLIFAVVPLGCLSSCYSEFQCRFSKTDSITAAAET